MDLFDELGCFGFILVVLISLAFGFFVTGFVVWGLWELLMVNGFGLEPLSYWVCCGIGLLFSVLTGGIKITVKR